jgi:hypothetical protein
MLSVVGPSLMFDQFLQNSGVIMKLIGKWQVLDEVKGASVLRLALSVGNITSGAAGMVYAMPPQLYFDDNLFFEVREDEKRKKYIPRPESQV